MDNNKLQKVRRRVPLIHTNSNACQIQNEDVHRSSIQSFFIAALQKFVHSYPIFLKVIHRVARFSPLGPCLSSALFFCVLHSSQQCFPSNLLTHKVALASP